MIFKQRKIEKVRKEDHLSFKDGLWQSGFQMRQSKELFQQELMLSKMVA